jgi:hypothetical protein
MRLRDLCLRGCMRLLARDKVRGGHVEAHDIEVMDADARGFDERPKGYGVQVVPGAFTLWNQQPDPAVTITADLTGLSAGRAGAAVRGSGIFVGGAGDAGGRLLVRRLETGGYGDRMPYFQNVGSVVTSSRKSNRGCWPMHSRHFAFAR